VAAGFLTGNKWEFLAKAKSDQKFIICNADEGDPGAYMNRNEIEGDPHALLEGMIIGGYVMGASQGIIYARAEYPLAAHRLERAIEQARDYGILGDNILGRGFKCDVEGVEGAGAFVCGEETALIASLEGEAGRPRPRPPFPAQKGLWGKPSNINNVETWYNIAPIILKGAAWFSETGSAKSSGTKVFSLVGKINNTGLVEMPLGTPLKTFVYDIGEGNAPGREIKAVQTEAVTKRASLNGIKTVLRCLERRFCFQSKRLLLRTMGRLCPSQGGRAEHVQHCLQVVGHGRQADLGLRSG
jgi:NADH-quinone oxidoreductase subunit F